MSPTPRGRHGALPPTSRAILALLSSGEDLSGYEIKKLAESPLWFHWAAPAMSQIYAELSRLADSGLVTRQEDPTRNGKTARYRVTKAGLVELSSWACEEGAPFPVLKHPIVLRLLLGHLGGDRAMSEMLTSYVAQLAAQREQLQQVSDGLSDEPYLAYVAEWGLRYYDFEEAMARHVIERIGTRAAGAPDTGLYRRPPDPPDPVSGRS